MEGNFISVMTITYARSRMTKCCHSAFLICHSERSEESPP